MVKTIEILPFVEGAAPQHWWQWGLVIVVAASGGIGLLVVICYVAKSLWKLLHVSIKRFDCRTDDVAETKARHRCGQEGPEAAGSTSEAEQLAREFLRSDPAEANFVRRVSRRVQISTYAG